MRTSLKPRNTDTSHEYHHHDSTQQSVLRLYSEHLEGALSTLQSARGLETKRRVVAHHCAPNLLDTLQLTRLCIKLKEERHLHIFDMVVQTSGGGQKIG